MKLATLMSDTPCGAPHGDPGTAAFDEAVITGIQRKRTVTEILTDLLQAEAAHPRGPRAASRTGWVGTPPPSATA